MRHHPALARDLGRAIDIRVRSQVGGDDRPHGGPAAHARALVTASGRREQRERDDQPRAVVDAAVGEHLAVVGELELAADEAVRELAGLDGERADVAGDLVVVGRRRVGVRRAPEDDLEDALPVARRAGSRSTPTRCGAIVSGAGSGAAIENIAPVRSMRVDGPGAWRSSKFSTNSADTMCMAREGNRADRPARRAIVAPCRESFDINRANWDERAPAHAASPDYGVARFADDPAYLSERRDVRPPAARVGRRTARRPPAVPHRHRHGVARPPRRPDDRPRLLPGRARRGPPARRRGRRRRRVRRVRRVRRAGRPRPPARSTSSTRASAR